MSRRFGILVLALTFAYVGFILWKIIPQRPATVLIKPHPRADISLVRRDLCTLAGAELRYQKLTGRYGSLQDLNSDGKLGLMPHAPWPYIYVMEMPASDQFTIRAVASQSDPTLPSMLSIDDQMQVQSRTRPPQIYPCPIVETTDTKSKSF